MSADTVAVIPQPITALGQRRRDDIMRIATELFAARGYDGTRMDDLADAVGLNKATLYHYYASKSLRHLPAHRRQRLWKRSDWRRTALPDAHWLEHGPCDAGHGRRPQWRRGLLQEALILARGLASLRLTRSGARKPS